MSTTINLLEQTKLLLAHRGDTTLVEIADGAGVDYSWLAKFSQGRIPDASVNRVQAVYDFLLPLVVLPRKRNGSSRARAS